MTHTKQTLQTDPGEVMQAKAYAKEVEKAKKQLEDKIIEGMQSPLTGPLTLAEVEEIYNEAKKHKISS